MGAFIPGLLPLIGLLLISQTTDPEGVARAKKELEPRLVQLVQDKMPLDQALKSLEEQSGNKIVDRRKKPANPLLKLNLRETTFWQALDEIARQAGCGYSLYQDDGRLALVDTPLPKLMVIYQGIFRLAIKRVDVTRDDETGSHFCTVHGEMAWEPRFQPFLLDVGPVQGIFSAGEGELANKFMESGRGQMTVAGRNAVEFDLRLPAPARSTARIATLTGQMHILGPSKMLEFVFANPKPGQENKQIQDEVQISLKTKTPQPDRWSYEVVVTNPPGGPRLESYQEAIWLSNNRIFLRKGEGEKVQVIRPLPNDEEDFGVTARQATIVYHFTRNLPASPSGWSVVYRTPGRMINLPVTFTWQDIPLP